MTGPEFLQFYLIYGLSGLALAGLLRFFYLRSTNSGDLRWKPGYYPRNEEAYGIALLRGGRNEAVRALLSRLVTAGVLAIQGHDLRRLKDREAEANLSPLERRALQSVGEIQAVVTVEARMRTAVRPELEQMEHDLELQGLTPSSQQRTGFRAILTLALLAIPGLGAVKLLVALGRDKSNVQYLIVMMILYAMAALLLLKAPRLTRAGRQYLDWLRESHQGLVRAIENGKRNDVGEMVLAAGIFGLAVPALSPLYAQQPTPRRERKEDGSADGGYVGGDSDDRSDSGDSGGDGGGDGGGGDGGGGCGGGCGGCGGG